MKVHSRFLSVFLAGLLLAGSTLLPSDAVPVTGGQSPWMLNITRTAVSKKKDTPAAPAKNRLPAILCGTWSGILPTFVAKGKYVEDPVTMSVSGQVGSQKLAFQLDSYDGNYLLPNSWSVSDGVLRFSLYDPNWQLDAELSAASEIELTGKITQYGQEHAFTLYKLSNSAKDPTDSPGFVFEGEEASVWQEKLLAYPTFSDVSFGVPIPFSYELRRWDRSMPLLSRFPQLASAVSDNSLRTMKTVMDILCDNVTHDGSSGMPETTDVQSVLDYYTGVSPTGIECRGMSILLSEMLRLCGIPAKPITCLPENDPCEECHVVVHAYSAELGQWVLLDPTYRLMLQDSEGRYISLPELRQALITGAPLTANADAGHNGMPFMMDWYRAYMTKNTFRFSCAVQFSALSQENGEGVARWMLVPEGFSLPYWAQRPEQVTTSATDFWAAP